MNVKQILYRCFYGIFTLLFGLLTLKILLGDTIHNYKTLPLFLYMLLGIGLLAGSYMLLKKFASRLDPLYKFILPAFLLIYGIILLYFGFQLRFTPAFDMDAIYGGAIEWVNTGSFPSYYEYFGYFPNNLGSMSFLHTFFWIASLFGITDFFAVGIVLNTLLFLATVLVSSLICRKLNNNTAGLLCLVFFLLCVPFYFISAAFYTDALSLLFPVLFYYLYLLFKEQKDWKGRIVFGILMGLVLTLGSLIKFTVIIALIAVIIDALLSIHWKEVLLMAGITIFMVAAGTSLFDSYIYQTHITDEACQDLKTPYWHWIMMGLQNCGYYSPDDYTYTRSYPVDERSEACIERIQERIGELGISGLFELWTNKALVCFADGTYALSDFLDDTPAQEVGIHKYILYGGEKYSSYQTMTTGFLLALYALMVFGCAVSAFWKKEPTKDFTFVAPRLAVMGIFAFLLLWETSGRYFTNYIPMMIVCAVLAISWKDFRTKPVSINRKM